MNTTLFSTRFARRSLGLHICNFPLRLQAVPGPRPPPSWYDPLGIPASPDRGKALRGLDSRVDFFELDYEWALKGADVALGCLGFVRGMRGVLPINAGVLAKAIETCAGLSRVLKRKVRMATSDASSKGGGSHLTLEAAEKWQSAISRALT